MLTMFADGNATALRSLVVQPNRKASACSLFAPADQGQKDRVRATSTGTGLFLLMLYRGQSVRRDSLSPPFLLCGTRCCSFAFQGEQKTLSRFGWKQAFCFRDIPGRRLIRSVIKGQPSNQLVDYPH